MRSVIIALVMVLLVAGCATVAGYKIMLNTWLNKHEDDLVRKWGPPNRVHKLTDGNRIFYYIRRRSVYIPGNTTPGTATTTLIGNTAYTTFRPSVTTSGSTIGFFCETQFEISEGGTILNWKFNGNDCKAVPPTKG